MKINIGSGYKRYEGVINLDSSPSCNPDYVVDLEKDRFPFEDSTVEEVMASHVLEHLGEGFFHCMQEIYRVCKNGAIVHISVPHPNHDTFKMDPTHRRPIMEHTLVMLSRKHNLRDIALGGNETPIGIIYNFDFELVDRRYHLDDYFVKMFETLTEQQCDHVVRTCNNVIIGMDFIMKVVKNEESA